MSKKLFSLKSFVSVSVATVCLASAFRIAPPAMVETAAADTLNAWEITEQMKLGWNYGNSLDATASAGTQLADHAGVESEIAWGNPKANQALFTEIKKKGFNTVRIPTTWFQHLDENNQIDPEWMARVKEVVDYCINEDMYVILNVHHENWVNRADLGTAYDEMHTKLMAIWTQIANEFKDYDQHLVFECMNEPRAAGTDHEWWGPTQDELNTINQLNADFVKLIRSIDSPYKDTRLLMIPGYCASSDITIMSKIVVPDDDYVAVSVHAYSPYGFAMDATVEDHSVFTEAWSAELDGILSNIRKTFTDKDIPVVIGEFSASNYGNTEARCEWATQYISTTKKYGIPCVLWDNDARGNADKSESHDYINRKAVINGTVSDSNPVWYPDSEQVVDTMVKVAEDSSIVWGSERHAPTINHADLSSGTTVSGDKYNLDAAVEDGNCTPGLNITWAELEGNEVAIKFTGDAPVLAITNGEWQNWTEYNPYDIDETNGVAYYSADNIKSGWGGDVSEMAHLFARTNGNTSIDGIYIIKAATVEQQTTPTTSKNPDQTQTTASSTDSGNTPTTETTVVPDDFKFEAVKYKVEFPEQKSANQSLKMKFKGTPGASIGGCVGYSNGPTPDDWVNYDWDSTIGADGTAEVEIFLDKMFGGLDSTVTSGEVQIWWSNIWDNATETSIDKPCEMTEYNIYEYGMGGGTTPDETTEPTENTTESTENTTGDLPEPGDVVYGDANVDGDVTIADAVAILQYLANSDEYPLLGPALANADCCDVGDGINTEDALAIQKLDAKVINDLPASSK